MKRTQEKDFNKDSIGVIEKTGTISSMNNQHIKAVFTMGSLIQFQRELLTL